MQDTHVPIRVVREGHELQEFWENFNHGFCMVASMSMIFCRKRLLHGGSYTTISTRRVEMPDIELRWCTLMISLKALLSSSMLYFTESNIELHKLHKVQSFRGLNEPLQQRGWSPYRESEVTAPCTLVLVEGLLCW